MFDFLCVARYNLRKQKLLQGRVRGTPDSRPAVKAREPSPVRGLTRWNSEADGIVRMGEEVILVPSEP